MGSVGSEACAAPSRRGTETISSIMLDPAIKGVMAGLVPAISLMGGVPKRDARVKPAHDSGEDYSPASSFMMR
jgi:hypothetical protein